MEPYIGEIRLAGFGYAPKGWALCQGQTLPISQNQALFSLLGTSYGGNGTVTFMLPDLRGRVLIGTGNSPVGGSNYSIGNQGGSEGHVLTLAELPAHQHQVTASMVTGSAPDNYTPNGNYLANSDIKQYGPGTSTPDTTMAANSVTGTTSIAGKNTPHENRQPYIAMNYMIALTGIFPSRS